VKAKAGSKRSRGYVLFGSRNSGSAAVEAALEMAGAPYRIVDAATWRRKDDPQTIARLERANPLHQVPTLVCSDGSVLTESAAILIQLALAHPRARLLPAAPAARGQALRALVFIAANCYSNIGILDYPERWLGSSSSKAERERLRKGARRRLHRMWSVFAEHVAPVSHRFLFAAQPGAADILAAVVSRWSGTRKHLAKHHPALYEVVERVEAHPSLAPVFARHWGAGPVAIG
jgi:GST-like protein